MFRTVYLELVNGFKEIPLISLIPYQEDLQSYYLNYYSNNRYSLNLMKLRFKNLECTSL
jgi:hypothetical protein